MDVKSIQGFLGTKGGIDQNTDLFITCYGMRRVSDRAQRNGSRDTGREERQKDTSQCIGTTSCGGVAVRLPSCMPAAASNHRKI